jgi:hypothetical protein
LRLLNLLLGLVAVLIGAALAKAWVFPVAPALGPAATKPSQEAEALAYNPPARPPLTQFEVLLEKNPFKQPPPVAAQPFAAAPPPPLPALAGTILVDHDRRAILSDKGKSNIYAVGQGVAGGVITEIKEDRILFKRGDTTQEIMLKAVIESGATPAAQAGAPGAGQPVVAGPSLQPSQPAPTPSAGGDVADQAEKLRLRQERQQMREQRRALRRGAG